MEINTSLSGYGRTPVVYENLRKSEAVAEMETAPVIRRDNALTGSSAVLSSSLANALWAVQEKQDALLQSSNGDQNTMSRVESRYFEFAN